MNTSSSKPYCLDFFSGSGLVTEGLKKYFQTIWANDICEKKGKVFCANHKKEIFQLGPIENIKGEDLPEALLWWGSFPCQDLSLAGNLSGITNSRSGLIWHWIRLIDEVNKKPPLIVAENVIGLVSASKGEYYRRLHKELIARNYKAGAIILDASNWVPQSRKRVFIIGIDKEISTQKFEKNGPTWCHPKGIVRVSEGLDNWVWWNLPHPTKRKIQLEDIIDLNAPCDNLEKQKRHLSLIPNKHIKKMHHASTIGQKIFPGYKRIRNGHQVLELRFDGLAGCLRTPEGGSSRQVLVIKNNGIEKTRLLTIDETAGLMGVRKSYKIPGTYNDGYKAMGDAVVVPVTRFLAKEILAPLATIINNKNQCL